MMNKKHIFFILFFLLSIMVFASSDAHADTHHGFDWLGFFGKVFNSSVLFGGLFFLLRKPITNFLGQKTIDVKADIVGREEKIKEAKDELSGILKRLEAIEDDIKVLNDEAVKSGKVEKKKLKEIGEIESKRIMEQSEEEINYKIESSIKGLRTRIAQMTVDQFRESFKGELNKKIHEKIIEDNIKISGDIIQTKTDEAVK